MQVENFTSKVKSYFNRILIKDAKTFHVGN